MIIRTASSTELKIPTTGATIVNLSGPPEVEARIRERTEYIKRLPQRDPDDPELLAHMQRLMSKPRIRTLTYSAGG